MATTYSPGKHNQLTDVPGLSVGQAHDADVRTGVTVVLPEAPAVAAVDVRGGGPGTRETDALAPTSLVEKIHAIVLSGGSAFGLDAAGATAAQLAARGIGFPVAGAVVPIVPSAILFDLANGGNKAWGEIPPYRRLAAAALAAAGPTVARGDAGAGYGATCGALKGGIGSASIQRHTDCHAHETVAALIAVNAFGDAVVPGGTRLWAAPFELGAEMGNQAALPDVRPQAPDYIEGKPLAEAETPSNTTIGVIATDVALSRSEALRIAMMAHDGLARAIRPIHTPFDGDTLFVLSTGQRQLALNDPLARARLITRLGTMAADVTTRAVGNGMVSAQSLNGWPSYRDWLTDHT